MSLREGPLLKGLGGQPKHISRSTLLRYAGKVVLVGGAYYVAAVLGLRLALIERNVTPLWPPTGIAVVAFLIFGWRVWPGVALAALAVNLPISTNGLAAAATAAGNTLAPVVAALLLVRVGFRREIDRLQDALAIVFLAALLSMSSALRSGRGRWCFPEPYRQASSRPHGRCGGPATPWEFWSFPRSSSSCSRGLGADRSENAPSSGRSSSSSPPCPSS